MKTLINIRSVLLAMVAGCALPLAAQDAFEIAPGPGAISEHTMIRDSANDRLVVFGGVRGGALSNQVFAYYPGKNLWMELSPAGDAPSPRREPLSVYDARRNRMIVFGGQSEKGDTNDSFALDLTPGAEQWLQLCNDDDVKPPVRTNGDLVIDEANDRAILIGGYHAPVTYYDVWALDLTEGAENWGRAPLNTVGFPAAPSLGNAVVYDADAQRLLVYRAHYGRLYELTLYGQPTWTDLTGPDTPAGNRRYVAHAFDTTRHAMIIHGGLNGTVSHTEAYLLDIDKMAWTKLASEEDSNGRFWHTGAYDELRDQFVMVGGKSGTPRVQLSTMASLQGAVGTPVPVAPANGDIMKGEVLSLAWEPASAAEGYMVEIFCANGDSLSGDITVTVEGETATVVMPRVEERNVEQQFTYYWRVMGYNQHTHGEFSEYAEFIHVVEPAKQEAPKPELGSSNGQVGSVIGDVDQVVNFGAGSLQEGVISSADENETVVSLAAPAQAAPQGDEAAGCAGGEAGEGLTLSLLALLALAMGLRLGRKARNA